GDLPSEFRATEFGQNHVSYEHVNRSSVLARDVDSLGSIRRLQHLVSMQIEVGGYRFSHCRFILNQQDDLALSLGIFYLWCGSRRQGGIDIGKIEAERAAAA